jgi:translation initiation factor IF-1
MPATVAKKSGALVVFGTVEQSLPNANFRVRLENGYLVTAYVSGRMRQHRTRVRPGERVEVELSPYDVTKGRILCNFP